MASTSFTENNNGDVQIMAEYDFKNPVTATVLIYESDEELNTPTPVKESGKETNKDLDSIVSEIFEDIIRVTATTGHENQLNPESYPCQNRLSNSLSDNIVCETFQHTVQEINKTGQKVIDNVGSYVNNKERRLSLVSKVNDYEKSEQSGAALNNSTAFVTCQAMPIKDNLVYVPSQTTSKKRPRQASTSQTSKKRKTGTNSNATGVSEYQSSETTSTHSKAASNQIVLATAPQTVNEVQTKLTRRVPFQSENNFVANQCLKKLLDTVSTHMVFIMKAHVDFVAAVTKRTSNRDEENAKKRFIETRAHFFNLSLTVVTNIIIPRENDNVFVYNFIQDTVRIAHLRHLNTNYIDMKLLYNEMCDWAKSQTFKNSILTELLLKGSETHMTQNTSKRHEFEKSDYASSNTSKFLFRSGPPGRELSISLDPNLQQHNQNTVQYPKQIIPTRHNNYPGEDSNNMNRMGAQLPVTNTNNMLSCCNSQQTMLPSNPRQENTTQPPAYHYPAKTHSQALPPYHQTWYSKTFHQQRHPETQITSSTQDQSFVSEQEHLETNRSLSRDSGFQSPLNSLPTDAMSSSPRDDQMVQLSPQVTPLITHVTSLNPSVLLIKDGECHVCGTLTKQKCLGCYKSYYCSHQCQTADWKNHVWMCKYKKYSY